MKTIIATSTFFFLASLVLFTSCHHFYQQDDCCAIEQDTLQNLGIIKNTGMYAVDGCGIFIEINGTTYKPSNEREITLNDKVLFYENDYSKPEVLITYKLIEDQEYSCGFKVSESSKGIYVYSLEPVK